VARNYAAAGNSSVAHGPDREHERLEEKINFGRRVKEIRGERRWTLEQLSQKSGLSISALSKIENDQVSASFDTIVKIAHAFGHTFGEFFRPQQSLQSVPGRRTSTRAGQGVCFTTANYDYEVHSAELTRKGMIPLVMRIRARTLAPIEAWSSHDGEEFIYVTSGLVEVHTEFYAPIRLGVGDSAYIDSTMRHAFVSLGEGDAEMLSICMTESLQFNGPATSAD
jgi:transcriptional regulator with XRE-family HTH domain